MRGGRPLSFLSVLPFERRARVCFEREVLVGPESLSSAALAQAQMAARRAAAADAETDSLRRVCAAVPHQIMFGHTHTQSRAATPCAAFSLRYTAAAGGGSGGATARSHQPAAAQLSKPLARSLARCCDALRAPPASKSTTLRCPSSSPLHLPPQAAPCGGEKAGGRAGVAGALISRGSSSLHHPSPPVAVRRRCCPAFSFISSFYLLGPRSRAASQKPPSLTRRLSRGSGARPNRR